jgi:hypothetical protein
MTRKAAPKPEGATRGVFRTGEPECWKCSKEDGRPGFVGYPDDTHTPYVDCGGNPARHQRTPLELGVRA